MAKQLSLLSYVKTPNLARNRDNETAASESTVVILDSDEENVNESSNEGDEKCEEKGKSDEEDIESDEEGKEEDISAENIIYLEEELVECTAECCNYPRDKPNQPTTKSVLAKTKRIQGTGRNEQARCVQSSWFQKHGWLTLCTTRNR